MKLFSLATALFLAALPALASDEPMLKTEKDRVNYGIGVGVVNNFKLQGMEVDLELVIRGMRDAYAGKKLLMNDEELGRAQSTFQSEFRKKRAERMARESGENKEAGEAFLAGNAKKDGVVTLPSGLQYKVLKAGDGKRPGDADIVLCRYRGTLLNGTEFSRSPQNGEPARLKVLQVVPGWREALKLMPVGSHWKLFIPAHLAYGARGSAPRVGPHATLVLDLELVAIQ